MSRFDLIGFQCLSQWFHDVHLLILTVQALYRFRCSGPPEFVEILQMALESQWLHGYPRPAPRWRPASPKITGLPLHPSFRQGATWRAAAHSWNLQAPGTWTWKRSQMEDAQIVECWPGIAMELCGSQVLVRYATVDGFRLSSLWLPSDCRNFQILSDAYWTLVEVRQMLNLVPGAQTVLDPFCGSGPPLAWEMVTWGLAKERSAGLSLRGQGADSSVARCCHDRSTGPGHLLAACRWFAPLLCHTRSWFQMRKGNWLSSVAPLHFALTEGKQAIGCDAFPRLGFIGSSQHQMCLTASTNGREVWGWRYLFRITTVAWSHFRWGDYLHQIVPAEPRWCREAWPPKDASTSLRVWIATWGCLASVVLWRLMPTARLWHFRQLCQRMGSQRTLPLHWWELRKAECRCNT